MIFPSMVLVALLASGQALTEPPPVLGVAGTTEEIRRRLQRVEREFREKWGGLTVEELAPPSVKDSRNRALPIIDAVNLCKELIGDKRPTSLFDIARRFSVAEAGRYAESDNIELLYYRPILDMLSTLDLLPESNFGVDYTEAIHMRPVRLLDVVYVNRLLTILVLADLAGGECDDALNGLTRVLAFAEAFEAEPDELLQLVRRNSDREALGLLREILVHCELPRKELERLSLIVLHDERRSPVEMILFDHVLAQQPMFDLAASASEVEVDKVQIERLLIAARLQVLRFLSASLEHAAAPRWERREAPSLERFGFRAFPEDEDEPWPDDPESAISHVIQLGFTGLENALDRNDLWVARFGLARTAVALSLYAKDHEGEYPADLVRFVPRYLVELPLDPFDGSFFEYEVTKEGYRLIASEEATVIWYFKVDPVLDWSQPRREPRSTDTENESDQP